MPGNLETGFNDYLPTRSTRKRAREHEAGIRFKTVEKGI